MILGLMKDLENHWSLTSLPNGCLTDFCLTSCDGALTTFEHLLKHICPNQIPCHFSFISSNSTSHFESESCSVMTNSLRPHGLYSPWNSPGQNTGVGSLSLLQRIFPTQGSNPGLLHCRWILYQLSHQGSRRILEWVAYPFSSTSF